MANAAAPALGVRARRTISATLVAGGVVLVASAAAAAVPLAWPPAPLALGSPVATLVAGAAFALLFFLVFERSGFVLYWGRQSTTVTLDEAALFLGALVLPMPHLVLGVAIASSVTQWLHRRTPIKAAFNVAQYAIAAALAGASVAAASALGVPAPWAALPAPVVFAFVTAFATAAVLATIGGQPVLQTFRERFGHWLMAGALGTIVGTTVYALYALHPVAALLSVPLVLSLRRFGRLNELADDDLRTHGLLAAASARLAGEADLDRVAEEVLVACHQLLDCGDAEVTLGTGDGRSRVWRRAFLGSGGDRSGGVRARIGPATEATVGEVAAYPPRGQRAYGERERHVLLTIGAAAAAALANARALAAESETVRRVQNAHRELEEFTLWTTHDLREPLRGVETLAAFLAEDVDRMSPEEARDVAERIQVAAGRLKERVKGLHAFSRIVQHDRPFEPVDLDSVVRDTVAVLAPKADEKRAIIKLPAEPFPTVRAQRHRLDIVFGNLVENALKYGPAEGAVVEVGFRREAAGGWEFHVRDNGPGIPREYHETIFHLFQRGPTTSEPGSGAGLAIVKRVVEQHGGSVWVESEPGSGACFRFTLPEAPDDIGDATAASARVT